MLGLLKKDRKGGYMHVALLAASLCLVGADFNICNATLDQYYPAAIFASNQYYVFWADYRYSTDYALFGARVSATGTVLDPSGKVLFRRQTAYAPSVAYDGTNLLVAGRDSC
jgi:hypothetical protein